MYPPKLIMQPERCVDPQTMQRGPSPSAVICNNVSGDGSESSRVMAAPAPPAPASYSSLRIPAQYHVVKCGSPGHNIRSRPSVEANSIGMLTLGNKIRALEEVSNSEGEWIRLDAESASRYVKYE